MKNIKPGIDESKQFQDDLLTSVRQMKSGRD